MPEKCFTHTCREDRWHQRCHLRQCPLFNRGSKVWMGAPCTTALAKSAVSRCSCKHSDVRVVLQTQSLLTQHVYRTTSRHQTSSTKGFLLPATGKAAGLLTQLGYVTYSLGKRAAETSADILAYLVVHILAAASTAEAGDVELPFFHAFDPIVTYY